MKSFMFGLGFGLLIVSVIFYFIYGYQVKANNWENDAAKNATDAEIMQRAQQLGMVSAIEAEPTEEEIIDLATRLGMVSAQEAEPSEEEIIELASDLGMVFAQGGKNGEAQSGGLTNDVTDESESGAALSVVSGLGENDSEAGSVGDDAGETSMGTGFNRDDGADEGEAVNTGGGFAANNENADGNGDDGGSGEGLSALASGEVITDENGRIAVDIPEGLNAYEVAVLLRSKGIISEENIFIDFLNERGLTRIIQYGRYYFFENEDLEEIAEKFRIAALNS
ncbi:MAG: endolytic transglycosylase MltG [Clostridiales bacterium]|nr:endolytic transglycosylase MltG [Clostridiales bacterium]